MRCGLVAMLLSLSAACQSDGSPFRAEVLPTPFPGTVLTVRSAGGGCSPDGCEFAYTMRVENPTDRDADVQECALVDAPHMKLHVTGPMPGVAIRAHAVRHVNGRFLLPSGRKGANDLIGQRVSCTGLDWHGNEPI
jgi:hypothetical protein